MGSCINKTLPLEKSTEVETCQIKKGSAKFECSPKSFKLEPIRLNINGDNDFTDICQEPLEHQVSIQKFEKLQKKWSTKDQKPTMVSETIILDFRRPSITSPAKSPVDKGSKNLNQRFINFVQNN